MIAETSDITNRSQVSIVLRYIHNNILIARFLGCSDVSCDRTAGELANHFTCVVEGFECKNTLTATLTMELPF